ncbi:zinc carboxypeptidase-like [Cydia strobilella]|uniref:zinc carboxypeptidase-like n=1 Tax=Cydia strobilella TaxID=1100964 RepID=UPI003006F201
MLLKIVLLSLICSLTSADQFRYDGYALYKIIPQNEHQVQFLKDLEYNDKELDFWRPPTRVGEYVSVVAPLEKKADLKKCLTQINIHNEVMLDSIQEAIDAQVHSRKKRSPRVIREPVMYFEGYHTLENINNWFQHLAEQHSNIVTLVTAGTSHEGRNITGIKIARNSNRPAFFLEAGQIGADWLSPTVVCYIVDQLVRGDDPAALAASQDYEWHIFPSVNPDGFEFSDNSVRLWTKNRRPQRGNEIGVDLTRNWNSQWGVRGGSFSPAEASFIGIGPFSEPETRALSRYIESIGHNLAAVLSFRGFGQRLLIPYAHTTEPLENYNDMITIGRRAMGSLAVKHGTQYLVGNSATVHDGATGVLVDWAKYRFRPPVAATFLLRDNTGWGHILPVAQVLPSCEETYDAVIAIIREAKFINVL